MVHRARAACYVNATRFEICDGRMGSLRGSANLHHYAEQIVSARTFTGRCPERTWPLAPRNDKHTIKVYGVLGKFASLISRRINL
jgi:hypothetical protein